MNKPVMLTATYNGVEHTLSIKPWCRLLGRSPSFVYSRLSKAESAKHPNPMQFVVQESNDWQANKRVIKPEKRAQARMGSADSCRMKREERHRNEIIPLVNGFIYPKNAELHMKMEG